MKVRITQAFGLYTPGQVVNVTKNLADKWIADGIASTSARPDLTSAGGQLCIVAAADSAGAYRADFICSGSADQNTVNRALAQIRGFPGRLLFLVGTYGLTDHIIPDTSWLTLEGECFGFWDKYTGSNGIATFPRSVVGGPGGVLFKQATAGKGVFRLGTNYFNGDTRHKALNFVKLSMYSADATGVAIYDNTAADICRVVQCNIQGFGSGIDVLWDNPIICDNNIQDTGGGQASNTLPGAIRIRGYRGFVKDNVIYQTGGIGIWCGAWGATLTGNVIGLTNDHNIMVVNAKVKVIGNDLGGPGAGGVTGVDNICLGNYQGTGTYTFGILGKPVYGCVVMGNTCSMITEDNNTFPQNITGSCITVGDDGGTLGSPNAASSNYNVIMGNTCTSSKTTNISAGIYAIDLRNSSSFNSVVGNTINGLWNNGSASVTIGAGAGSGNQIANNVGHT